MANKTFRKPHNSTKDATGMCLYIQHRKITLWDAKSHLTTKNHTGERGGGGKQRGSKVISEGMSVCASDRCQISVAKKQNKTLEWLFLSDCRSEWKGFATQDQARNRHKKYLYSQVYHPDGANPSSSRSDHQIKTNTKNLFAITIWSRSCIWKKKKK